MRSQRGLTVGGGSGARGSGRDEGCAIGQKGEPRFFVCRVVEPNVPGLDDDFIVGGGADRCMAGGAAEFLVTRRDKCRSIRLAPELSVARKARNGFGLLAQDDSSFIDSIINYLRTVQPKASSSGDSRGVPQTRQMTEEQSPHTRGSSTERAQTGHQRRMGSCAGGEGAGVEGVSGMGLLCL